MVSYNIFTSPSSLHSFPLATIPQPRQQVFPFFGTLQLLPSSHTSLKWYISPKKSYSIINVRTASFWQPASFSAAGSLLLPIVPILAPSKPPVNDFSILHLLYIYRYSVIYPPHIYNSMLFTYGTQFMLFCIPSFYVNSLYGVFGRSAWFYRGQGQNAL